MFLHKEITLTDSFKTAFKETETIMIVGLPGWFLRRFQTMLGLIVRVNVGFIYLLI